MQKKMQYTMKTNLIFFLVMTRYPNKKHNKETLLAVYAHYLNYFSGLIFFLYAMQLVWFGIDNTYFLDCFLYVLFLFDWLIEWTGLYAVPAMLKQFNLTIVKTTVHAHFFYIKIEHITYFNDISDWKLNKIRMKYDKTIIQRFATVGIMI